MSELLPCPFCGGDKIEVERDDIPWGILERHVEWWKLRCVQCRHNTDYPSESGIIKRWNTRTPAQQLTKPSENVTCGDLSNVGDIQAELLAALCSAKEAINVLAFNANRSLPTTMNEIIRINQTIGYINDVIKRAEQKGGENHE